MKLIVGLGNPGLRYRNTRHNIGFLIIDSFAKVNKVRIYKKGFGSLFNKMIFDNEEVLLLKPQTFMNNSGEAVKAAVGNFGIKTDDILVICDDVNLPLGVGRFRVQGSSGGHKGLKSVIERLNSKNFNRLRIGIDAGKNSTLTEYVLSGFRSNEKKLVKAIVETATCAAGIWVKEGIETAMNKFNTEEKWR